MRTCGARGCAGPARCQTDFNPRVGAEPVLPLILAAEASDTHAYQDQPEARAAGLPGEERSHGRVFRTIVANIRSGLTGQAVARLEGRHRATGGNALRAAVLGVTTGFVPI